jgi:hypothetical protein
MLDPITFSLKVQQAVAVGALCFVGVAAAAWVRLLKGETQMLAFPFHRRSEEMHAHHDYVASGASWADHYGKRAHDVDVEHMR